MLRVVGSKVIFRRSLFQMSSQWTAFSTPSQNALPCAGAGLQGNRNDSPLNPKACPSYLPTKEGWRGIGCPSNNPLSLSIVSIYWNQSVPFFTDDTHYVFLQRQSNIKMTLPPLPSGILRATSLTLGTERLDPVSSLPVRPIIPTEGGMGCIP